MEHYRIVFSPLCEPKLAPNSRIIKFGDTFEIVPLQASTRNELMMFYEGNDKSAAGLLLEHASCLISVSVPLIEPLSDQDDSSEFVQVAEMLVRRFMDCLCLFRDVVTSDQFHCWYGSKTDLAKIDAYDIVDLTPDFDFPENFGVVANYVRDVNEVATDRSNGATDEAILSEISLRWSKFELLGGFRRCLGAYLDPKKREYYRQISEQRVARMNTDSISSQSDRFSYVPIGDFGSVLGKEIEKLDDKHYNQPSGRRYFRAFQVFCDSCHLRQPHGYVALATCLEALLSVGSSEVMFQLTSRIAWLLARDDAAKRVELMKEVKDLYDLRSRIVHGGRYKVDELLDKDKRLRAITRRVLVAVLSNDDLFKVFFSSATEESDKYLTRLTVGAYS